MLFALCYRCPVIQSTLYARANQSQSTQLKLCFTSTHHSVNPSSTPNIRPSSEHLPRWSGLHIFPPFQALTGFDRLLSNIIHIRSSNHGQPQLHPLFLNHQVRDKHPRLDLRHVQFWPSLVHLRMPPLQTKDLSTVFDQDNLRGVQVEITGLGET